MARPEKHTADYFPFYAKDGKTLFILESKYGCKGTGFFTNVLRFLCDTPDHHYSLKEESDRLFFFSKTKCDEESGMDMLNIMAKTSKIISQWWVSSAVIYSPDLIDSLKDAYRSRRNTLLTQDEIMVIYGINTPSGEFLAPETPQVDGVNDADNPQKKGKEKKGKEKEPFLSDSIECGLSDLLFQKIISRNPNSKQPNIQSWAKDIDLMIRVDNRSPDEIKKIIEWCQNDSFWQNNILSTAKLREKYDQLFLKMKSSGNGNGGSVANASPPTAVVSCPVCGDRVLRSALTPTGCVQCDIRGHIQP